MKTNIRRILAVLIVCVLASSLVSGTALAVSTESGAAKETYKTVRIGWYQSAMFQEGDPSDETKSGYCYDYLQKVADYASWKFEYVYGNWDELFNKLQKGEIDFLGGISITSERKKTVLFPEYALGTGQYYLFKRMSDKSIFVDR